MSTRIFYFTGSGNSLAIARTLAEGLGAAQVLPMAKHLRDVSIADAACVGLVTPVYAWGPPRMVNEFISGLKTRKDQYVFAVANCGGNLAATLKILRRRLRAAGSHLDAGFGVRAGFVPPLPGMEFGIIKFVAWLGRKTMPGHFADRKDQILEAVRASAAHKPESQAWTANLVGSLMHSAAAGAFPRIDRDFSVGDECVSCGTCTQICPRENVTLVDGRPTWHQNCESCYACYLWCPQKAISFKGARPTDPTHHPDVTLGDMLLR
ncbi:MAG: EFR1 family ferrodoxin [Candidatus Bipolaricaulota bacterium]|nr:MAG: EFR1 family ferrodoxin [Candidatus Bipolaricaulota bacterium]